MLWNHYVLLVLNKFWLSFVLPQLLYRSFSPFEWSRWTFSVRPNCFCIIVCVSWGKKCLFFGKFDALCFLETPVLRFALLPYYRRNMAIRVFAYRRAAIFFSSVLSNIFSQRKALVNCCFEHLPYMCCLLFYSRNFHGGIFLPIFKLNRLIRDMVD